MRPDDEKPTDLCRPPHPHGEAPQHQSVCMSLSPSLSLCGRARRSSRVRDATTDGIVRTDHQLAVRPQVENAAGRVVRCRAKAIAARQEPSPDDVYVCVCVCALQFTVSSWCGGAAYTGSVWPYWTLLISFSWPANVCTHLRTRTSHTLASVSHPPDTNRLGCVGCTDKLHGTTHTVSDTHTHNLSAHRHMHIH
jgi:hypothetical protein